MCKSTDQYCDDNSFTWSDGQSKIYPRNSTTIIRPEEFYRTKKYTMSKVMLMVGGGEETSFGPDDRTYARVSFGTDPTEYILP